MAQFGDDKREAFLGHLRNGVRRMAAAEAVGVVYSTVWRAMDGDPAFKSAVNDAEMRADEEIEDALYQAALAGNVTAIQVWLYNRRPLQWRDMRQLAVAARMQIDAPAEVIDVTDLSDASTPQIADPEKVVQLSQWLRAQ